MPELVRAERWTGPNAGLPDALAGPVTEHYIAKRKRQKHAMRMRSGKGPAAPQQGDGWRLTPADRRLLMALARHGAMTWQQASTHFYGGVQRTAIRRIGYLREAGLIGQWRADEGTGNILYGKPAGHNEVRDDLWIRIEKPSARPRERLLHRLAMTDAALNFEARGHQVLTEREILIAEHQPGLAERVVASLGVPARSAPDGNGIYRWFAVPIGADAKLHYPDLVLVTPDGLVAIEVEITPKSASRTRQILRGYKAAGMFKQVVYLATAEIGAMLHGWRNPDGGWSPGLLHEVGLLPDGPPQYDDQSRVRVLPCTPSDPGVAYRLDLKQVDDQWFIPRTEWSELRAKWEADTEVGKTAGTQFVKWWIDIEVPRRRAARRTA